MLYDFIARCYKTHTSQKVHLSCRQSIEYSPKGLRGHSDVFLCVLFGQQWFSPWNSAMVVIFVIFIVQSCTLTLTEAVEACSSLDVVLGSFVTSWMSHHRALQAILVNQTFLGRSTTVPYFLHLWIMASTMLYKFLCNPFQTHTRQLLFISSILEFLLIAAFCCSFLRCFG